MTEIHTRTALAWIAALLAIVSPLCAESHLTLAEAQRLCFPSAQSFVKTTTRLTPDQIKQIENQSGVKVRIPFLSAYTAQKDGSTLGVLLLDFVIGKHEVIDYALAISPDGKVQQIEILAYRESYGHEIRGKNWRAQFAGKTAADKLRNNDDIHNIAGATMSCAHITEGVRRLLATFEIALKPALTPPPR